MSIKKDIKPIDKDGKPHGLWKRYYHDNGNLSSKGYYLNGKQHGLCEWYHDNGKLSSKGYYLNGKKHGLCESYHSNGNLSSKIYYLR